MSDHDMDEVQGHEVGFTPETSEKGDQDSSYGSDNQIPSTTAQSNRFNLLETFMHIRRQAGDDPNEINRLLRLYDDNQASGPAFKLVKIYDYLEEQASGDRDLWLQMVDEIDRAIRTGHYSLRRDPSVVRVASGAEQNISSPGGSDHSSNRTPSNADDEDMGVDEEVTSPHGAFEETDDSDEDEDEGDECEHEESGIKDNQVREADQCSESFYSDMDEDGYEEDEIEHHEADEADRGSELSDSDMDEDECEEGEIQDDEVDRTDEEPDSLDDMDIRSLDDVDTPPTESTQGRTPEQDKSVARREVAGEKPCSINIRVPARNNISIDVDESVMSDVNIKIGRSGS